jgi:hypothetical protein
MGAFTLTNAALLSGLALLAVPVVAHLLQRQSRRPVVFSSIALLRECIAQHSRLNRLKRLILMALRMLAVACVVLAFTRPVWLSSQLAAQSDREAAAGVVLLIDTSLSTSQKAGAGIFFDRLRADANRILGELRSGVDFANVVIADDAPRAVFPHLSRNLPALRAELERLAPGQERADFNTAFSVAARLLESHAGPRRIVILSDNQNSNWNEDRQSENGAFSLPAGTSVVLTKREDSPPGNIGLSNPECFPAIPTAGQAVDLTVAIQNASDETKQSVVAVNVAGIAGGPSVEQEQTIVLGPRAERRVKFAVTLPEGAIHAVTFRVKGSDGLAGDDRASLVIGSAQQAPVLIVSDDDPDDPGTAAFYLARALAPYDGLTEGSVAGRFSVRHIRSAEISSENLQGVSAVFLGYLGVLSETHAKSLVDFVKSGGGLVLFGGEGAADRNVAILNDAGEGKLAPWLLSSRQVFSRGDAPLRITSGRWQSKWFREFDEQSQLAIQEIGFKSVWNAATAAVDAEVLLLFSNGRPALGSRTYGRGQFLLADFSPEAASSDLGKHGPFVALAQMVAATLHQATESAGAALVGEPLRFSTPVSSLNYRVIGPAGGDLAATRTEGVEGGRVMLAHAREAGVYQLEVEGTVAGAAAVNIDPRESDLSVATPSIEDRLKPSEAANSTRVMRISNSGSLDLEGRPLWGACFTLAMGAIAMELLLLGVWRR